MNVCVIALLLTTLPESKAKFAEGKNSKHDPLLSLLTNDGIKMYAGSLAAIIAGISFHFSHSLSKTYVMSADESSLEGGLSRTSKSIASLAITLALGTGVFIGTVGLAHSSKSSENMNLFAELFWIGIFSLSAKAAL